MKTVALGILVLIFGPFFLLYTIGFIVYAAQGDAVGMIVALALAAFCFLITRQACLALVKPKPEPKAPYIIVNGVAYPIVESQTYTTGGVSATYIVGDYVRDSEPLTSTEIRYSREA